jgi:predicted methyltransferase
MSRLLPVLLALGLALSGAAAGGVAPEIDAALAIAGRSDADRQRDATNDPGEVLTFFGVRPGMVVLDLFAGGGYFSEIVGHVVGPSGRVYMHNNAAYLGFAGEALDARIAAGGLDNVERYDREADAIDLPDASVDLVLMVMTYHDFYFRTEDWQLDPDAMFAMLHRVLKPGGVLAIVDHVAPDGTGKSAVQDLHRIEPAFARADIEAHGFVWTGETDALRNPTDQYTLGVFDPAVRGKTDRFVYRFTSP